MILYAFDLLLKEILPQKGKLKRFNFGMQTYFVKQLNWNIYRLKTKNMASLTNDGREIRQPDNITLDSHKETTETQTDVASRPCVRVTLLNRVCWVWLRSLFILILIKHGGQVVTRCFKWL